MKINYTERNENTIKELFSSTDDNLDFDFDSIDDRALLLNILTKDLFNYLNLKSIMSILTAEMKWLIFLFQN